MGAIQSVGAGSSNANNTTVAAAVANVPTPGSSLIAIGINAANAVALSSVDDGLNFWEVLIPGAVSGWNIWVARCDVRGDMTGLTVTATLNGASDGKLLWVVEFDKLGALVANPWRGQAFDGTNRQIGFGLDVHPRAGGIIIGAWGIGGSGGETGLTPDAGYTNLPTETGSGYYNGVGVNGFVEGVWRVATGATEQPGANGVSILGYDCACVAFDPIEPLYPDFSRFPRQVLRRPSAGVR